MKLKSVAGVTYLVKDIEKTAKFYEDLGFLSSKREKDYASVRLNWFWIDFYQDVSSTNSEQEADKGVGHALCMSVEDVDDFYKDIVAKGFKPESEPKDVGVNREFFLIDPDGYKLVFLKRK